MDAEYIQPPASRRYNNKPGTMNNTTDTIDIETLKGLEPLSVLSDDRLGELAKQTIIEYLDSDVHLFREGDHDNQAVYLLNGEIELSNETKNYSHIISAGTEESWHPLAPKQPRQLSAVTLSPVEVIRIDQDQLDGLLTWDQMTATDDKADTSSGSASRFGWISNIQPTATFRSLPAANIEKMFERMERIEVNKGDVIIRQGDPGDYYYLIDHGEAVVTRETENGEEIATLAKLGYGNSFGEEALISDKPRNATVTMLTNGALMRLAKKDFVELLKEPLLNWISLDDALAKMQDNSQCLDVRVDSEFEQGHLPGAINIPLHELRQRTDELNNDTNYICYCNTGRRSSAAAFLMSQFGFKASVLQDGIQGLPSGFLIR